MVKDDLIREEIKKGLKSSNSETLKFIYEYLKFQNMTKEEQEKIEDDKYTTISKIINQLCETVYYNCILTENFIDTIVNRRNMDI
ncbi:hypothetical protein ACSSOE_06205 [Intestinibacter bartlettii]|uniref:hypothetical protein n=1 Tax=Intestinibacter bartlettii TaxID=261299 RepID=UPI00241D0A18|nr:hypothetical protein [Intestinibacter bartlettii]MDU4256774.1 hypothetical protein [Intestinibacter bartlettii]MDU6823354.1 hypothetical protein [Intestinibacter bartlettii]